DRPGLAAAPVVAGGEEPAGLGPYTEQVEEAAADPQALGRLCLAAAREVERRPAEGECAREGVLAIADLLPDRVRQARPPVREVPPGALLRHRRDLDQLFRPYHGQRLQPHGVDHLEDRRVRADPDREREDRDGGESRLPQEQARGVAQILAEPLEPRPAPHLARHFLDRRDVAELAPRGGARLGRVLAALDAIPRRHVEVGAQFVLKLAILAPRHHTSSGLGRLRMPPIASTSWSHLDRSEASWRLPAAVNR